MQHLRIAQAIDEHYRHKAFIAPDARFDAETFVFAGSVKGTVFEKDGVDTRYHHRLAELNRYYGDRLSFGSGDEVLQVAHVSSTFILKYLLDRTPKLLRALWPQPQANL